jgi:predicted tellurium resistance membrane protein TerC
MAVVFISPKQRQKVFFMGITIIFLLFLIAVAFVVFLSKPKEVPQTLVFNKPKVSINLKVFESDQFKNLQPFEEMQMQFSYSAVTKQKKEVTGFISAVSESDARKILEGMDLRVLSIEEAEIGRENPFTPYYEQTPVTPDKSK